MIAVRRWRARRGRARRTGYTLVELAIVLALVGLLSGLSITTYLRQVEKARVARAIAELSALAKLIDGSTVDGAPLPDSLPDGDIRLPDDPWGNPYRYLKIAGMLPPGAGATRAGLPPVAAPAGGGGGPPAIAQARKDGFLVPINSDYDLYSMGRDGESKPSLNSQTSRDDVIRAGDGAFFGLAEAF